MKKEETKTKEVKRKRKVTKKESEIIKGNISFSLIEVICIVLITGMAVSVSSGILVYNNYDKLNYQVVSADNSELSEFVDNYNKILNNYVEEVDKNKLIESAIAGMYNYIGDEYTMLIDDETTSSLNEQLNGEYTGIGVEITNELDSSDNVIIRVKRVFKNSPAERAGIKENDILTKVDGKKMSDSNEFVESVKKGNKESYKISYIRNSKEYTVEITRQRVLINSVSSKEYNNVGYIKIETFSQTTESQVVDILDSFGKNINSLVIDVRDNTGGYLETAYTVSDLFIEKGKNIYQIKERNSSVAVYKALSNPHRKFNKIVVLVNSNSASASEILALALRESASAKIVGVKTYGKGTVQETSSLSTGAMVKYTKAYWLSPNGNSINKVGITPDIEVEDESKQLDEAIKAAR